MEEYDSTIITYENEDDEIKRLVTSAYLSNMFRVYDESPAPYKIKIYSRLHSFFQKLDISHFKEDIAKYPWYRRYKYVKRHKAGLIPINPLKISKHFMNNIDTDYDSKSPESNIYHGLIVSLTSFPARINTVHKTIESILTQTILPEKIILWLAYEQFPDRRNELPEELTDLEKYGLEIRFCEDLGPHKKYYNTMQEYPFHIVITIDDDATYNHGMIEMLLNSYFKFPGAISCMRAKKITFTNGKINPYKKWMRATDLICNHPSMLTMATGVGGVLYPPGIMPEETFDKDLLKETCLFGDDLWLKANQIMNNVPTVIARLNRHPRRIEGTQEIALWRDNVMKGKNDSQLTDIDSGMIKKYNFSPLDVLHAEFDIRGR